MNIPFFPYADLYKQDKENYLRIFDEVCSRGAFILQKDLEEFEENIRNFIGVKHAFGVANGTDALILGLKSLGIGSGDQVILPSHTYIASPASVHLVGAEPILTECGSDGMMDCNDIEHRIGERTVAIMPVHINGRTCNMDKIQAIAKKYELMIVEDAAQGLGSRFKGKSAGTFGSFGTISFYPAKLLGCFGDGGLIMTNDDEIADALYLLRDHGRDQNGDVTKWGYNSRLDNLQAAILNHKLSHYQEDIEHRRTIANVYNEGLKDLSCLKLPLPPSDGDNFDVFQNYELHAENRDNLKDYLAKNGIGTIIQWAGVPVHKFKDLGFNQSLPFTDMFFEGCLMLPMNSALEIEQAEYIVKTVRNFYE